MSLEPSSKWGRLTQIIYAQANKTVNKLPGRKITERGDSNRPTFLKNWVFSYTNCASILLNSEKIAAISYRITALSAHGSIEETVGNSCPARAAAQI